MNLSVSFDELPAADHPLTLAFDDRRATEFDHRNPSCLLKDMLLESGTVPIMVIPFLQLTNTKHMQT